MSTYYDLHCKACDKGAGFHVADYNIDALGELWTNRGLFIALDDAGLTNTLDISLMGDAHRGLRSLPEFARVHRAHDVRIIDGYGIYMAQCREHATCGACGHRHNCTADHGHDGPHVPPVSR